MEYRCYIRTRSNCREVALTEASFQLSTVPSTQAWFLALFVFAMLAIAYTPAARRLASITAYLCRRQECQNSPCPRASSLPSAVYKAHTTHS